MALGGGEDLAVAGGCEDAVIACLARGAVEVGGLNEETLVVELVLGGEELAGGGRGDEAMILRVAGGADAGSAAEGGEFDAGIVCDNIESRCESAVVDSFRPSIAFEGGLIFWRWRNPVKTWQV